MLDRKLLLVSGKGGVGKSAVAASIALAGARLGKRVLVVGMVDAVGIAAHLGREELSYEPHEVHPGIFALAVERSTALEEYLRIQLHVPRATPTRQVARALNVLVDTVPGIREIISMGKPVFETWRDTHDVVIVDAPPLGQLFSYLRAPATIAGLVPTGQVRTQAEQIRNTLADPKTTGLILVTTPEELPVIETVGALEELEEESLVDLAGLVVNRVLPPLEVDMDPSTLEPGPHREAAALHASLHGQQEKWRSRLPDHHSLPYLFGLLTPGEVAARLAEQWEA